MPVFSLPPWVRRLWVPCLWLLLWQGAALLVGEELLLPAPLPVLGRMAALLGEGRFWLACGHSLGRILLGFLLGVALGCLLAVLIVSLPRLYFRELDTAPAQELDINEVDGEPIYHADEEEGSDDE